MVVASGFSEVGMLSLGIGLVVRRSGDEAGANSHHLQRGHQCMRARDALERRVGVVVGSLGSLRFAT